MTHTFLRLYYIVLTTVFLHHWDYFFKSTHVTRDQSLFILEIAFLVLCIVRPILLNRVVVSLLLITLLLIKFGSGNIYHSEHIWLISSILMCTIDRHQIFNHSKNIFSLRLMQATLLSFYFISGIWKLRRLGFSNWQEASFEHLALATAEGNGPSDSLLTFLTVEHPEILVAGFSIALVFQVFSIIPVLTERFFLFWGVAAILFHLTTGMVLNIWFVPTILGAFVLLILAPLIQRIESNGSLGRFKELLII